MIEVSGVSKRFGNFVCLDEVSLTVRDGTIYGLVGENGAGKSTLLRLIAGVYRADAGEIQDRREEGFLGFGQKGRFLYAGQTVL